MQKAGTTDVEKVIAALPGTETPNLTGGTAKVLPNHHITKPVYIGEVKADGQFNVVWKSAGEVPGEAWSDYLPGSKDIEADWVTLKCGNYNTGHQEVFGTELQVMKHLPPGGQWLFVLLLALWGASSWYAPNLRKRRKLSCRRSASCARRRTPTRRVLPNG